MKHYIQKASILFLCLSLITAKTVAQSSTLTAWEITFNAALESKGPADSSDNNQLFARAFAAEMAKRKEEKPPLHCYVTANKLRIETNGPISTVELGDKRDSSAYILSDNDNTATKVNLIRHDTAFAGDSMILLNIDSYKFTFTTDTATIAGIPCKKAIVSIIAVPTADIVVWYAPTLPQMYWDKYDYLTRIPGCVMAVLAEHENMSIGIKAVIAHEITVPTSLFEVPKKYRIRK